MPSEPAPQVKLAIAHVLFIDIVGYSKLLITQQTEWLGKLTVLVRETEQFQEADKKGGLVRIPTGDGLALVFRDSPEAPAQCAMELNRRLKAHPELQVRMGIHSGPINEVVDVNGHINVTGAGINVAQRVMDCGDAGHILLSHRIADDLEQYPQWRPCLHDLGPCEVKHGQQLNLVNLYTNEVGNPSVPEKLRRHQEPAIRGTAEKSARRVLPFALAGIAIAIVVGFFVLQVNRRSTSRPGPAGAPMSPAEVTEKGIAVLPFENLSQDPENAYFADGIQEEILTRLAKISDLKVISRTSASKFGSSKDNLREVAGKLGVAHILEGTVQKSADQVRVNVQLINATSDAHLWAETYDRKLTDVFAIETEIARVIADKLRAKLTGREEAAISSQPTENSEAHQLYLKGRYFWNKRTSDGLRKSISYFNQAIEKDPVYGPAYAGLADAYSVLPNYSQTPGKEAYPKAEAAALKALEIDDNLAEAHISLANIRVWHKWGRVAEPEFKKGLQLDPNYSTGHQWYSIYLSVTGRPDEAISEMEKARELDPFSIIINTELGCPYLYSKQYDRAVEYFEKAVEMEPDFPFAHFALAEAYDRIGRYKEALSEHEKAVALGRREGAIDLPGTDAPKAWYALTGPLQKAYRALGESDYWQKRLDSTKRLYDQGTVPASAVAGIYAILGENEQALTWLEKAFEESDDFLVFLNIQPQFEPLHSDPRFHTLVEKIFHALSVQLAQTPARL